MRRLAFIVAILASAIALPARAALLPDCDQSRYIVQRDNVAELCDVTNPTTDVCLILTPEKYYEQYPNQADQDQHPPTVTTINQCGFNDFVMLFINLANWGLGLLAALGLLFAIYGGFLFITAAGNQERVRQGKSTLWGGFLGTMIVLTSWIIVSFVVSAFTGTGPTVFFGTQYERKFTGSGCPNYRKCPKDNLYYDATKKVGCRDDSRANGNAVSQVQKILLDNGCYHDLFDGCYGPKTKAAVLAFQEKNKGVEIVTRVPAITLPSVDGIVGPETWELLNMYVAGNDEVMGCEETPSMSASVTITSTSFSPTTVRLKAGGTVHFKNQSDFIWTVEGLDGAGVLRGARWRTANQRSSLDLTISTPGMFEYTLVNPPPGTAGTLSGGKIIVKG